MAPDASNNTVLLELLRRHLENKPHENAEITINAAKYEILSSTLDFLVKDASSSLVAARVILAVRDASQRDGATTTELAVHIMTTTTDPNGFSPSSSLVILDEIPKANGGSSPATAPPHRASTIPTHPHTHNNPNGRPLAEIYKEYIPTFMADPPTATTKLPNFLHQPVTHNTHALNIREYHNLGQEVRDAIPDLGCEIVDLIADEGRQVVAARLEFSGTLVKPFAGARPPAGRMKVKIPEIVFYWFDGGMIREVISLVDMEGLGGES